MKIQGSKKIEILSESLIIPTEKIFRIRGEQTGYISLRN